MLSSPDSISGKVAKEHVHVLISYHPMQMVSDIVQTLYNTCEHYAHRIQ